MDKTASRKGIHSLDDFQHMLNVNLTGTFSLCPCCRQVNDRRDPLDDDGERGVIINVASIAGYESPAGKVAYGASKAGVIA
ncbi:MAG: SDR family NAD(P)-dependent oxidoreductase [Candidatus Reddybacter sp.]